MRRLLLAIALALAGCDGSSGGYAPTPGAPLDLNRATMHQLEQLPAIGIKHARSIIASRNARGGRFRSVEHQLKSFPHDGHDGIGEKTVDAIRAYVVVRP